MAGQLGIRHPVSHLPARGAARHIYAQCDRGAHRQLRKAVKTKSHFPSEDARTLLYLAIQNAVPAWTRTRNWTTALLAFKAHFGDRLPD